MDQFQIVELEDSIVNQIKQFENELKIKTGRDMAIVAYTHKQDDAGSAKTNQ